MTKGIRPARLRIHIRSSIARARATSRYISTRSASLRPTDAASGLAAGLVADSPRVTAIALVRLLRVGRSEVDGAAVDGHRRLADDLGQGRVRVRRGADLPGGRIERERQRGLRDQVRRVRPDDVDAEGVLRLRVREHLGKALVLAADDRLGDRLERDLADLVRRARGLELLLGLADRGDLGTAVRGSRLRVVVEVVDVRVAGDRVRRGDALVPGGVGEPQSADDVADRVDVRLTGAHPAV